MGPAAAAKPAKRATGKRRVKRMLKDEAGLCEREVVCWSVRGGVGRLWGTKSLFLGGLLYHYGVRERRVRFENPDGQLPTGTWHEDGLKVGGGA